MKNLLPKDKMFGEKEGVVESTSKKLSEIELPKSLIINLSKVMESLGDYLISIGNIEKDNPEFKKFMEKFQENPEEFEEFLEKMPTEIANGMLNILLKMVILQQKTNKMDKLDAKEKIDIGRNMKSIAKSLNKLEEELENV